jgi:TetR/AcrR family transcriptional regulator, regulator of biofilm formation and stress response
MVAAASAGRGQERGRVRRTALLRAAIALLAEGGGRAVTHRAVAAKAGVPLAATTYYFDSIQQLTDEALRLHVGERVEYFRGLRALADDSTLPIDDIAAVIVEALTAHDPRDTVAQFEVFLEAVRNPELRDAVAAALDAFEELIHSILVSLGATEPDAATSAFLCLLNGYAINHVARPRPDDAEKLQWAMRALFLTQLMTEQELAPLRSRLTAPRPARFAGRAARPTGS